MEVNGQLHVPATAPRIPSVAGWKGLAMVSSFRALQIAERM